MKRHDTTLTQEQKIAHTQEQLILSALAYEDASKMLSTIMDVCDKYDDLADCILLCPFYDDNRKGYCARLMAEDLYARLGMAEAKASKQHSENKYA